jgi:hypothetical protein
LQQEQKQGQEPEQLLEQVPVQLIAGSREQLRDLLDAEIVVVSALGKLVVSASAVAGAGIAVAADDDKPPMQAM